MSRITEKFERATKEKYRFPSSKGPLTTENLWDLSLTSLDNIAKAVNKEIKASEEESFLPSASNSSSSKASKMLDILKHVIQFKVDAQEASKKRAEKAQKLAQLREIAARKADEQLGEKSHEDVLKMIKELEENED